MHALLLTAAAVALATPVLVVGCSTPFRDLRTPSGDFCSDMPVVPAGQQPDREYHRLGPIASGPEARTEAERLESLRKAACGAGGDAVVEAVNEEIRLPNGTYGTVSSGTAVIWTRVTSTQARPITVHSSPAPTPPPEPEPQPQPPPEEPAPQPPPTVKTARPFGSPTATTAPKPPATSLPFGAPTGTNKLPTKKP
jgi:hypothetical protein